MLLGIRIVRVRFFKQKRSPDAPGRLDGGDGQGSSRTPDPGAKITVRSTKARRLSNRPTMHLSGRKGQATFTLRLHKAAFGKRLIVVTVAGTPIEGLEEELGERSALEAHRSEALAANTRERSSQPSGAPARLSQTKVTPEG